LISNNVKVQQLIVSGAEISARAGYDAFGLPGVLQQIGHYAKDDDSVALLFKTHPHPDIRLEKLDAKIGSRFDNIKGLTLANRLYRLKPAKQSR